VRTIAVEKHFEQSMFAFLDVETGSQETLP